MESLRTRALLAAFALVAADLAKRVLTLLLGADSSASGAFDALLPFASAWVAATLLLGDREPLLPGPATPGLPPRVLVRIVVVSLLMGGQLAVSTVVRVVFTGTSVSGQVGFIASWVAYRFAIGAALGGTALVELLAARRWPRSWRRDLLASLAAGALAAGALVVAGRSGQYFSALVATGSPLAAASRVRGWALWTGIYENEFRIALVAVAATTALLRLRGASLDVTIGAASLVGLVASAGEVTPANLVTVQGPHSSAFSAHLDAVRDAFSWLMIAPVLVPFGCALSDAIDARLGDALRAEDEPAPRVEPVPASAPATAASFVLLGGALLALVAGATLACVASWAPRFERLVTIEHALAVAFVGTGVAVVILGFAFTRRDRWPAVARLEGRASALGVLMGGAGVGFFAGLVDRIAATTDPGHHFTPSRGALAFASGAPALAIAGTLVALAAGARTSGEVLAFVALGLGGIELGLRAAGESYATVLFAVSPPGEDALVVFGAGAALVVAGAIAVAGRLDAARR